MPGFVDIQINGAFGVDFNADDLPLESVEFACTELAKAGTNTFYPTLITAPWDTMLQRIRRWVSLLESSANLRRIIAGIHLEGPFLSNQPGFVGAHPACDTRAADPGLARDLLDAGGGWVKLMTLSPERDPESRTIQALHDAGIKVLAGHSDASLYQLQHAIEHGLSGFTHLGNGTPLQLPRHDNILQRVLSLRDHLWITLIADGHHLPWFVLKNWLDLIPDDKAIIVSDAIFVAGQGPGRYRWGARDIEVLSNGACWDASREHFVGSATLLHQMAPQLQDHLHLSSDRIDQLTGANAARWMVDPCS